MTRPLKVVRCRHRRFRPPEDGKNRFLFAGWRRSTSVGRRLCDLHQVAHVGEPVRPVIAELAPDEVRDAAEGDEQGGGAGASQSSARGVAAVRQPAAPGSPRKVLAISEVDDFTDEDSDDEEEDVKVNIVKQGEAAPASTTAPPAAAPVDIDDFEDELD